MMYGNRVSIGLEFEGDVNVQPLVTLGRPLLGEQYPLKGTFALRVCTLPGFDWTRYRERETTPRPPPLTRPTTGF
jgi:hypothetical protein